MAGRARKIAVAAESAPAPEPAVPRLKGPRELPVLPVRHTVLFPFAILPLYAAAEKFDFGLLDAARDLGATAFRSFWSVFLPGIRKGITTALVIVFVPMLFFEGLGGRFFRPLGIAYIASILASLLATLA